MNSNVRNKVTLVFMLLSILIMTACSSVSETPAASDLEVETEALSSDVLYSSKSNLKSADLLDAEVITGTIYLFPKNSAMVGASYKLDGSKLSVDKNLTATVDTRKLSDGVHVLETVLTKKTGKTRESVATFLVDNKGKLSDQILVSTSSKRTGATLLAGSSVQGDMHVFFMPSSDIKKVVFYIDNKRVKNEGKAFYDLAGTAKDNTAKGYDTSKLSDGTHEVKAVVVNKKGKETTYKASFTVNNSGNKTKTPAPVIEPAPTPDPEPTPAPTPAPSDKTSTGKIYYVATNGNDNNDGSFAKPFKTLNRAGRAVKPGDTIQIRGGVYYEYNDIRDSLGLPQTGFKTSGTKDKPITIESYPGERAIIDGSKLPNGKAFRPEDGPKNDPQRPYLLYLPVNYYIVRNLEVRNSVGAGVVTNPGLIETAGNYNTFSNLELHHNHGNGLSAHGYSYTKSNGRNVNILATGNVAEYIVAHHNQSIRNGGDSSDGIKMSHSKNGIIRNSLLYKNADDGMDFIGSHDMTVQDSVAWLNGHFWADGDTDPYSTAKLIEAPKGNGQGFKMGGDSSGANSNNKSIGNIAFNNKNYGYHFNGAGAVKFYNNTSFNNGAGGYAARCSSNHELYNNISYNESGNSLAPKASKCPNAGEVKQSNNSWNLKITNPKFKTTNPKASDFLALSASSPAIDKGKPTGVWYTGKAPDLGALEYGQKATMSATDVLASFNNSSLSVLAMASAE